MTYNEEQLEMTGNSKMVKTLKCGGIVLAIIGAFFVLGAWQSNNFMRHASQIVANDDAQVTLVPSEEYTKTMEEMKTKQQQRNNLLFGTGFFFLCSGTVVAVVSAKQEKKNKSFEEAL